MTRTLTHLCPAVVATLVFGCQQTPEQVPLLEPLDFNGDDDDDSAGTPGECAITGTDDIELDVEPSMVIPTVFTVRWAAADSACPVTAYVEHGLDGSWNARTAARLASGEYTSTVTGLKAAHDYQLRAVLETDTDRWESPLVYLVTGPLPASFPSIEGWVDPDQSHAGGFLITALVSSSFTMAIFDGDGDAVWWYPYESDDHFLTRALLSQDKEWIVFMNEAGYMVGDQPGEAYGTEIVRIRLDGSDMESVPFPGGNHDFTELPDGTLAVVTYDDHEDGPELGVADSIVELRPDGEVVQVWTAWTHAEEWPEYVAEGDAWGHANALDYEPTADHYHLSLSAMNSIMTIDRATGDLVTVTGGQYSDYTFSEGDPFLSQHQFHFFDDRLLVFDNQYPEEFASYVEEYVLDPQNGTMDLVWSYSTDPAIYCPVLGDVLRLPNGNTLVTWSPGGLTEEVTPEGQVVRQLAAALGTAFGYTTWVDSLSPEIVAEVP